MKTRTLNEMAEILRTTSRWVKDWKASGKEDDLIAAANCEGFVPKWMDKEWTKYERGNWGRGER